MVIWVKGAVGVLDIWWAETGESQYERSRLYRNRNGTRAIRTSAATTQSAYMAGASEQLAWMETGSRPVSK